MKNKLFPAPVTKVGVCVCVCVCVLKIFGEDT